MTSVVSLKDVHSAEERNEALHAMILARVSDDILIEAISDLYLHDGKVFYTLLRHRREACAAKLSEKYIDNNMICNVHRHQFASVATSLFSIGRHDLVFRMGQLDISEEMDTAEFRHAQALALAAAGKYAEAHAMCESAKERPLILESTKLGIDYFSKWLAWHTTDKTFEAVELLPLQRDVFAAALADPHRDSGGFQVVESARDPELVQDLLKRVADIAAARSLAAYPAGDVPADVRARLPHLATSLASLPFHEAYASHGTADRGLEAVPLTAMETFSSHLGRIEGHRVKAIIRRHFFYSGMFDGKGLAFLSPFTGAVMTTRHSILHDHICAFFFVAPNPEESFIVLSSSYVDMAKTHLLIPALGLVLTLDTGPTQSKPLDSGFAVCAAIAARPDAHAKFLTSEATWAIAAGIVPNIAHNYLNEVAGLWLAKEKGHIAPTTPIVVAMYDHFDFARTLGIPATIVRAPSIRSIGEICLDNGWSPVRYSTFETFRTLAERMVALADEGVGVERPEMVDSLRDRDSVLFVLRSNRRIWRSQEDMVVRSIELLKERFGITRFLLDGVSKTVIGGPDEQRWIETDQAIADKIAQRVRDAMPDVEIASLIGLTLMEKVRVMAGVRFAIAPKGTGYTPIPAWIRHIPTLLHGNAFDIMAGRSEALYSEIGRIPLLMDRHLIDDNIGPKLDAEGENTPLPDIFTEGYDLQADGYYDTLLRSAQIYLKALQ